MNTKEFDFNDPHELLDRLRIELPGICNRAQIVGKWVWLEFNIPPDRTIRSKLKELGFRWNPLRRSWQHSCGWKPTTRSDHRLAQPAVTTEKIFQLNETQNTMREIQAKEFKVVSLRECLLPEQMAICDTSEKIAEYWRLHVATNPYFNPECECFVVLILNTRHRIKGHQLVSLGTMDTLLIHPREVFRGAMIAGAAKIVVAHNHPSGEPEPSEADIRMTRDLIRAGQLLKIEVIDHVVIGNPRHCSLRELGYFYS